MVIIGIQQIIAGLLLVLAGVHIMVLTPPSIFGAVLVVAGLYTLYNSFKVIPPSGV